MNPRRLTWPAVPESWPFTLQHASRVLVTINGVISLTVTCPDGQIWPTPAPLTSLCSLEEQHEIKYLHLLSTLHSLKLKKHKCFHLILKIALWHFTVT